MKPGTGPGPVTTLDLKEIFSKTPSAAPGKFYDSEAGTLLLGTLKTGGPCARVDLMPGEDGEHEQNWFKFRDRLENKDTVSYALFRYMDYFDRAGIVHYRSGETHPRPRCLQQYRGVRGLGYTRYPNGIEEGNHHLSNRHRGCVAVQ